jgi:hypothetical protein
LESAGVSKIFRVQRTRVIDSAALADQVAGLLGTAVQGHVEETLLRLRRLVPTFRKPAGVPVATLRRTAIRALSIAPGTGASDGVVASVKSAH